MDATTEAQALAAKLQQLLADEGPLAMVHEMSAHYGDKVAVTHEPAIESDTVYDGEKLRETYRAETAAIAGILTDFNLSGPITARGNTVTTHHTLSGKGPDGVVIEYFVEQTFTLEGDRIVALNSKNDPDGGAALGQALQASGFGADS